MTSTRLFFPTQDKTTFTPCLRFLVASDMHTQGENSSGTARVGRMLRLANAYAEKDPAYRRLDAVIAAGDLTDHGRPDQFDAFYAAVTGEMRPETRFLGVVARAHDGWTMNRRETHRYYTKLTGNAPDLHTVLGGYHFICVSASENDEVHYDAGQVAWLREQLSLAAAEDPMRPIFVFQHEHIRDTVYGSTAFDGWGETFFADVLKDFPQAVDFSGHSHYPLNHPASLWQGEYTAVGTGAIHYAEFTVDDRRTYHPENNGDVCTCWLAEADAAHNLRLVGLDILAGVPLCEYILANPADPRNRPFTPEKQTAASRPPVFPEGAEIKAAATETGTRLVFPAAISEDGTPVTLYRWSLSPAEEGAPAEGWLLPRYYIAAPEPELSLSLPVFAAGRTVRVTAETAWGKRSAPLTAVL